MPCGQSRNGRSRRSRWRRAAQEATRDGCTVALAVQGSPGSTLDAGDAAKRSAAPRCPRRPGGRRSSPNRPTPSIPSTCSFPIVSRPAPVRKKSTCRARVRPTIPLPLTTSESAAIPAPQASRWGAVVVGVVRSTQRMLQISSRVSLWEVSYRVACARIPTAYGAGDGIALELAQKRMTTSPRLEASQNPQSVVATQVVGSSGARRAKLTRFTSGNFPKSHVAVSRACSSSTLIDLIPRQTCSFDSLIVSSFLAHSAHSLARR
jgi:hypothetical protein